MAAFESAVSCGVSPQEFWGLTPYLTRTAMSGARKYQIKTAWFSAAFTRAKKLPGLDDLLSKMDSKPKGAAGLKNALAGFGRSR
jgi:hypothetical protein